MARIVLRKRWVQDLYTYSNIIYRYTFICRHDNCLE